MNNTTRPVKPAAIRRFEQQVAQLRHEHITRIKLQALARIAAQSQGMAFFKRQVG